MSHQQVSDVIDELRLSQQVAFLEPSNKRLLPLKGVDLDQWATHLAHISAQEPGNLLNHVRRIYLHLALKQSDPLYGAMLDLYLVLGHNGEPLRHHLLQKAGKLLSQERHDLFISHFNQGLHSTQPLPACQYSVLGNFFSGKMRLVTEQKAEPEPANRQIDPLELAKEELNYGDISVAQQILEEALLQSPHMLELHYGLLEIYKHTRSLDALLAMKERLGEGAAIAQTAWNQMQRTLESRGS
jgi:tetratricopeptide (TPR) repeat protein